MKALRTQNYYEILGVNRSASSEEVRKAYELSKVTYQDNSLATYSLFSDEENLEILSLISRAFETLYNPRLRTEYDDFLEGLQKGSSQLDFNQGLSNHVGQQAPKPGPGIQLGQPISKSFGEMAGKQEALGAANQGQAPPRPPPSPPRSAKSDAAVEKYLETVTTFSGPVLKKIRQLRGFSLEDIAEKTKIRKTYIEYIEEEEFTFLPAPIYVKGFTVMIARVLELPSQQVADDYMKFFNQPSTG